MPKTTKKTKGYVYALGRRKRSVARIRLLKGKDQTLVNDMPVGRYFKDISPVYFLKPFELTGTTGKFYVTAKIEGGGKQGQLGAFTLGVSRALVKIDENFRKILRQNGLLTRDPRERERRKFGLAQGARARKQSPKR
ncbi:30S ribosomal protein S9 [Candidatus Shapirobacteria bacterium CG03_land_8_20_14_0_80_39_12]|uniref:30S ribosomal protein S9 n=1 Tax=Candidatus Shapirobacteria bacterium CG03_land_8_20_14_0_80_39_12 TaxID=1974879 RepID=A0A2M7BEK7_9BACT|nr:MAG: 30S ribosomal protein S9 [Candidatus Shapirobacteria bacterium CG03_land_8_20_14_0_80_39_12]